jgi:DNA-binding transcriptional regulator PaaX
MHTPLDRYVLYLLHQFEHYSRIKGIIYTPYETIYRVTSPHSFHHSSVRHAVNNLEYKGVVEKISREQSSLFTLTEKGKNIASSLFPSDESIIPLAKVSHPPFWWQVVFDIPETKRKLRDALRNTLNDYGFVLWQKSVYIYPGDTPADANIIEMLKNPKWVEYLSLLSVEKVHIGADLLKLCRQSWDTDGIYITSQNLADKAKYISEQIGKKALNNNQKSSLQKEGQVIAKELFTLLEKIYTIPPYGFTSNPKDKVAQSLFSLSTELTRL